MLSNGENVAFHIQGSRYSWHARAAQSAAAGLPIALQPHTEFGDVVKACRTSDRDLGIIAIRTVVGTVDESAALVVTEGEAALPPIVGRIDLPVRLTMIGSPDGKSYEELQERMGHGVVCLAQKPAWLQCMEGIRKHLPRIRHSFRSESTTAVREVVERNDPNYIAIGPSFSVSRLGGRRIGPRQVNPRSSVTSFYIMQRNPLEPILPPDPEKTENRTVVSLALPKASGEFERCMEMAGDVGLRVTRFIPYDVDNPSRRNRRLKRSGGLLETAHHLYDPELAEFRARVHHFRDSDGMRTFETHRLGMYPWYPEAIIDPLSIDGTAHLPEHTEVPHRTLL